MTVWTNDEVGGDVWSDDEGLATVSSVRAELLATYAAQGGSSLVGFVQSGTGAIAESQQSRGRWDALITDFMSDVDRAALRAGSSVNASTAITNALLRGGRILWPEGSYTDDTARTLSNQTEWVAEGRGLVTLTNSTTGKAITISGTDNAFLGFNLVAANATHGIELLGAGSGTAYNKIDAIVTTAAASAIALHLSSDDVARGVFHNEIKVKATSGGNAYKETITSTGFINDNKFDTPILRTTANPGTVAILNGSKGQVFINSDASNYNAAVGNKAWDVQGTTAYPLWIGGLIDTNANTTGFTFASGVIAPRVIVQNDAGTTITWSGTTPPTGAVVLTDKNRFGEIYLDTPAFGTAGPAINFYDTGNNGDQLLFNKGDGFISIGLAKSAAKWRVNPSTGAAQACVDLATPAGGAAGKGVTMGSSAIGTFFGSGVPTLTAAQGSLYLRSDGSSTTTRAYINTDGGTTWTALTTAA